jgi:hypothetical protein
MLSEAFLLEEKTVKNLERKLVKKSREVCEEGSKSRSVLFCPFKTKKNNNI